MSRGAITPCNESVVCTLRYLRLSKSPEPRVKSFVTDVCLFISDIMQWILLLSIHLEASVRVTSRGHCQRDGTKGRRAGCRLVLTTFYLVFNLALKTIVKIIKENLVLMHTGSQRLLLSLASDIDKISI